MIKQRKHIAIVLWGIFLFPILFQSLHILEHHSDGHVCQHDSCQLQKVDKDYHENGNIDAENEKTCPICAYQFSLKDVAESIFLIKCYSCACALVCFHN